MRQTFNADWSGRRITAPNGADLLWSPGSEQAQVSLIESAQGFLDIYNEEMDSTPIEQALEADAQRGVNVEVTMTYDSSWKGAFAQLSAAGVHIRTYSASAPLYIHAKMILTSSRVFLGSQNFSYTSLERNRELGLITPNPTIRASLRRTFDSDYAGARPIHRPFPLLQRLVVGQRHSQPEFRRRTLQREHVLLKPLHRLRRVRALKPARADRDRHRRRRTLGQLSHRLKWLRRRLLPRSSQRGRRDGHRTRRARHVPRQAEPLMRATPAASHAKLILPTLTAGSLKSATYPLRANSSLGATRAEYGAAPREHALSANAEKVRALATDLVTRLSTFGG